MSGLSSFLSALGERALSAGVAAVYASILRLGDMRWHLWCSQNKVSALSQDSLDQACIAILVTQGGTRLPAAIVTLAAAVRSNGGSVLLVVNGMLRDRARDDAGTLAHILIERPPIGRDFGAYKAGIDYLAAARIAPKRLLMANDSMFYDRNKTPEMIRRLFEVEGDFIGATESHEPTYHIGSFIFAVSDRVLSSPAWKGYWRSYRPRSSRPHTIKHGELGLSRALLRAGVTPTVLYSVSDLAEWVRGWCLEDLTTRLAILPAELRAVVVRSRVEQVMRYGAARPVYLAKLVDDLLKLMEERSQVHWGGALMVEHLGMPIIKKDMAFRGLYAMNEMVSLGTRLGYPDMEEFKAEVRKRGIPASLGFFKRCLYRRGYI